MNMQQRNRINAMTTVAEVNEEIALATNNAGNIWCERLRKEHGEYIKALLNRKWELQGGGAVII